MPLPTTLAEGRSCLGVGPTRKPVLKGRRNAPLLKTERRGPLAGLSRPGLPRRQPDASSRPCRPYPHSIGPGPTRLGAGTTWTGRRLVIAGSTQVGHFHPAGRSTVCGAHPLRASQVGFGLSCGPPALSAGPAPAAAAHPNHRGGRLGWEPPGRSADPAALPSRGPGGISEPPGRTGLRRLHSGPGHGWSLPEPRKSDHPVDPGFTPAGPDGKHDIAPNR